MNLPIARTPEPSAEPKRRGQSYPRPIESIHQVEVTSRCDLRCVYCPSPKLDKPVEEGGFGRAKIDISDEHFYRALEWAVHFERQGTQNELALTGIGEPLLHPRLVEYLAAAREALPANPITFSTNGLALAKPSGDELLKRMKPYQPQIYVSTHRPEKAGLAIAKVKKAGLFATENTSFATDGAMDWAGQIDWPVQIEVTVMCAYLGLGWGVVLSDGRMTRCCYDATGEGSFGHVDDPIGALSTSPWSLCEPCHQVVP